MIRSPGTRRRTWDSSHWGTLAGVLRRGAVDVDGTALSRLPHEVVLGGELLARIPPRWRVNVESIWRRKSAQCVAMHPSTGRREHQRVCLT